jgi:hypothetical protein
MGPPHATLHDRRSSLAMTSLALCFLQAACAVGAVGDGNVFYRTKVISPYLRGELSSMPRDGDTVAQATLSTRAGVLADRVIAAAEVWLRPMDHLDYRVRRALIPVQFEQSTRSAAPPKTYSVRQAGLSTDALHAIGQRLRALYALERSLPSRLTTLLREFEERDHRTGGFEGAVV